MKTKLILATALVGSLAFSNMAWSKDDHSDDKREIVKTYDLNGFDEIEVLGVYELEIEVGKAFSVRTEASKKEAEDLEVRVSGDTLILDNSDKDRKGWNKHNNRKAVLAVITLPRLTDLDITGVATGEVSGVSGGSLDVALQGVGELELSGNCESFDIDLSGVGEIDAEDLVCADVDASLGGVGEMTVHATQRISADAGGIGQIKVYGDPAERDVDDGFMAKVRFK